MKLKILFFFSVFIFIWSSCALAVFAAGMPVIIIHQIRGQERCCQPGTRDMLVTINTHPDFQKLPLAWALRYDALMDQNMMQEVTRLPTIQSPGILVEVTPQLASDSGVLYKGDRDGSNWNSPRNAYLIGYSIPERQKLIDTVFQAFFKHFFTIPLLP